MAHVPGALGSGFPLAGRRVVDMADKIAYIAPDETKFLVLLNRLNAKETCHDIQFKWPEDEFFLLRGASGVMNGSSSAERFTWISWSSPYLVLQFNQAEDFRAFESAALATDTGIQVRIRWHSVGLAAWTTEDYYIRPKASPNGEFPIDRSTGRITFTSTLAGAEQLTAEAIATADTVVYMNVQDPSTVYDSTDKAYGGLQQMTGAVEETRKKAVIKDAFVQEFKVTLSLAQEMINTKMYGGPELARLHLRKAKQYKTNIENDLWKNGRGSSSCLGGTDPFGYDAPTTRMTGVGVGVMATGGGTDERGFIRSKNYCAADGGYNTDYQIDVSLGYTTFYTQLLDILEKVTETGSDTRFAFVSRPFMTAFDKGIRGEGFARWEMKSTDYGFKLGNITTTHCDLVLVPVRTFQGISMDSEDLSKYMVLLDMASVKLRTMAGMDTALYTNTQNNDIWGRQDEWRGCMGLQWVHEEQNAIINLKTA